MDADEQGRTGINSQLAVDIAPARELRIPMDAREQLNGGYGCKIKICQVNRIAREVQPSAYNSKHVCIGPYHRTWYPDLARDEEKNECVRAVLGSDSNVEVCRDELARLEDPLRGCYGDPFGRMDSDQYLGMHLLDGCYLLARCKEEDDHGGRKDGAPVAANGSLTLEADNSVDAPLVPAPATTAAGYYMLEDVAVLRDAFFLAENQVPFFIVEKIHQLAVSNGSASTTTTAANPIVGYAQKFLESRKYSVAKPALGGSSGPGNLLHLLQMHLKPMVLTSPSPTRSPAPVVGQWHPATEYRFAGIEFRSLSLGTDDVRCILDVKLSDGGGMLQIPCLSINGQTWDLLRNLMALEQCNPDAGTYVTAYCIFMSQLACRAEDVELLSKRGIIVHSLGNYSDVAIFFSNLCHGIVFDVDDPGSDYLSAIKLALEKRFHSRLRRWMAWLRRERLSNPWLVVALVAAALGLACEMVQAVFSVLSYARGNC